MKYIPADKVDQIARSLTHRLEACDRIINHRAHPERSKSAADYLTDAIGKALNALAGLARVPADAACDAMTAAGMDRLMAELVDRLPAIRGGGPDDFEELDPAFTSDPAGWPSYPDPECDGYVWEPAFDGPTPVEVLALDAPTWSPSADDWSDYFAADGAPLTDADHAVALGHV